MTGGRARTGTAIALLALGALALAGCGVKGSLDAPEGVVKSGEAKPGTVPDPKKPHQDSILDPILR
jgi:predicted small lipoprotein YifL